MIIEHITRDLTNERGARTPRALVDRLGGNVSAAARILQVPRRTLRGWLEGRKPRIGAQVVAARVRGALVQLRDPDYFTNAYTGRSRLVIEGTFTVSSDSRRRKLNVGRHIPVAVMQNVLNLWTQTDDTAAEQQLIAAIDQYYVEGITVDQITRTWFE